MSCIYLQSTIYELKAKGSGMRRVLNRFKDISPLNSSLDSSLLRRSWDGDYSHASASANRNHPLERRHSANTIAESIILVDVCDVNIRRFVTV